MYLNQKSAQHLDSSQNIPNSESDSLLNLYTDSSASNPNLNAPREEDQIPENMYRVEDHDPDIEKWIHRDKLAKIESEELQAAGFHLAKKTGSRTGRRAQSRDRLADESGRSEQNDHWASARTEKRPRMSSPADEGSESPDNSGWDLRTPEEIAATESAQTAKSYGNPVIRKSGSKIPVLTSSPVPIPSERLDRDTPIPRKRNFSGSIENDDALGSPKLRTRGHSFGSQNLLDETDHNYGTPASTNATRSGMKSAGTTSPTTGIKLAAVATTSPPSATRKVTPAGGRKTSNTHKPRVPSTSNNASPLQHPRHSDPDRPRTAVNRPEGEAPWIATMYKPDPRLPPDQQIIPTHAKKQQQQQQQLEKDGSTPRDQNREDSPLSRTDSEEKRAVFNQRQPSPSPPALGVENRDDPNAWPLRQMASVRSSRSSGRPGTSGSGTGGYSTMPKVISSPLNSPPIGALVNPTLSNGPQSLRQTREPDGPDKTKQRGCGCCIVM
jgi:hypothetical protein